jgi:hypothetical protein
MAIQRSSLLPSWAAQPTLVGATVALTLRGVAVLVLALFYLLWMMVRVAYRSLVSAAPEKNEVCHPKP